MLLIRLQIIVYDVVHINHICYRVHYPLCTIVLLLHLYQINNIMSPQLCTIDQVLCKYNDNII